MQPFDPKQHDEADEANALTPAEQHDMEAMLAALVLRVPSAELDTKVQIVLAEHATATTPATAPLYRLRPAIGLALAAGLALAGGLAIAFYAAGPVAPTTTAQQDPAPAESHAEAGPCATPSDAPTVTPVSYNFSQPPVNLRWSRDYDRGLLTADDGRRYRAYLRETIDQSTYVDPQAQATMQVAEPKQAYVIIPVAAY